ncbi:hypothetical protein [Haloglomus halophilum]|uniref:hypothetical protein n=1 Tax=Haloglomus halophilum TaxID=2962672 RepID=UPI0020C9F95E|nr:hypothetical protein [Haloglomus halophilum]
MTGNGTPGVSFAAATEELGLRILDPVDNHQYQLDTPAPIDPVPASGDRFAYPVDTATAVRTSAVRLPTATNVYVRAPDGALVASVEHLEQTTLDAGRYTLELLTPIKCYLQVESAVSIEADFAETRIDFGDDTDVLVGARSRRTRPATTVTTTADPADLLATVSTFGAALGTTMPERSYPSLRGHPPAVELGDELDTRGLAPPSTDVRLELPETTEAALTAAPLAYYLGAEVRAAAEARIVADGAVHPLSAGGSLGRAVEEALKTVFFMDCLTRYDGAYGHGRRLSEREAVTGQLGVDFEALYHADHAERVRRYLTIPYGTIQPHLPQWKVAATARPVASSVEILPFLVDDLALVRTPRSPGGSGGDESAQAEAVASFLSSDGSARSPAGGFTRGPSAGGSTRGSPSGGGGVRSTTAGDTDDLSFVSPEPADALEQVWVGEGVPFGASEAVLTAYRNRLARQAGDGEIDITVVCNDAAMDEETDVEAVYGQREHLPFEVNLRHDLSVSELADLLAEDHDFLHYIGHAEPDGLVCEDGKLDCGALDATGVDTFFFNACRSYRQARALIEAGAIVGVGSHTDVTNAGAVELGRTMARLLEYGFPFRAALDLARDFHPIGQQYIVVGDGSLSVVQCTSGTALLTEVRSADSGDLVLTLTGFPTPAHGIGSEFMPFLSGAENTYYLSSGTIDSFELSPAEAADFFGYASSPVRLDGDLVWSDTIDADSL